MSKFARFRAKNWLEEGIKTVSKNKKKTTLIILITISGCFFYNSLSSFSPKFYKNAFNISSENGQKIEAVINNNLKDPNAGQKNIQLAVKGISYESTKKPLEDKVEKQLYHLVGNAPIKEMIPSINELDDRVGAFVIGIAKKESDWGKHSPSKNGKSCYNYWGYKGSGSEGTSMGYACFGDPEEAVDIVGKRIEDLVNKNINEPRKFVVWKCGSSCAGHDPAGVQKWISDVSLYFGKVMKIQNS